jgi:hypothetical protein
MKSLGGIGKFFGRGKQAAPSFIGFRHPSGIGIRSKYYVIPLSRGASGFTRAVAEEGVLTLIENSIKASDAASLEFFDHTFLPRLASHPHTAGIFLIAVGDEAISVSEVAGRIQALGTPCEYMALQGFTDMELAGSLALSTAQELKAMALSGLDNVDPCKVTITYTDEPSDLPGLISLLEANSFLVDIRQVSSSRSNYLGEAALDGAHAILSFVEGDSYPSGTVVTPVLNIATDSLLHKAITSDFDLPSGSSHAEILAALQLTFGMVPTNSETTGLNEPLFPANLPSLNDDDGADEICLIPANPILIPFLIDLVSHQSGFFLKDRESFGEGPVQAKHVLVIGITASECQNAISALGNHEMESLTLEAHHSLQQLTEEILSHK